MSSFSVLMSVYNKEKSIYLDAAIESIWFSQSLKPNQIVLVQDGPLNDSLLTVIDEWKKKIGDTLTVVALEKNYGLAYALNVGLEHCKYDLVARMDSDDISLPNRFMLQIDFMDKNQEVSACSGQVDEYDIDMVSCVGVRRLPTDQNDIKRFARLRSPLSHPAVIFRKNKVLSLGGYPTLANSQDYALWSSMLANGLFLANLPETILNMRTDTELLKRRSFSYFINEVKLAHFQWKIGFFGFHYILINIAVKFFLRTSPVFVKKALYKHARS